MHINTKVVFEWDDKAQEYRETSSEGYEYDGEMMLMQDFPTTNLMNQYGSVGQNPFGTPDPFQYQGYLPNAPATNQTYTAPLQNFGFTGSLGPGYGPTTSGQNSGGWGLGGLFGSIGAGGQWGANQLQGQQGLDADAEGNWLDPALNIFGSYMQSKQGKAKQTSPEDLRKNLMEGMEPTLGTYEDMGKMAYGGGPIMDAARQKMRAGLHDASAQASNQMNTHLAQRGVGGLGDILNRKNFSQMGDLMNKGETDLTRYGIEAGLKGLQGTTDIQGGINTAVANLKQYNQNQANYHRAQKAAGSSAMYSGLLRGGLNFLGNQFGGSV